MADTGFVKAILNERLFQRVSGAGPIKGQRQLLEAGFAATLAALAWQQVRRAQRQRGSQATSCALLLHNPEPPKSLRTTKAAS